MGKKSINATKCSYDGIDFASKLEMYTYKRLKEEGIKATYERRSFTLLKKTRCWREYHASWNKKLTKRTEYVSPITYTPDFEGDNFIIECKGRKNERYQIIIKLFRVWNEKHLKKFIYEPKTNRQVEEMIEHIKHNKRRRFT